MTLDEQLMEKYRTVTEFIQTHHRNPSRYDPEERGKYVNWLKHNKKQLNAGLMKEGRVEAFRGLLELMERYKRKNQYE